jgi:hypothetical protein
MSKKTQNFSYDADLPEALREPWQADGYGLSGAFHSLEKTLYRVMKKIQQQEESEKQDPESENNKTNLD